jgi:hypothetical protein
MTRDPDARRVPMRSGDECESLIRAVLVPTSAAGGLLDRLIEDGRLSAFSAIASL